MSFGKNPYVARAEAAEQKAMEAVDEISRERGYREAAHQWDRAAQREKPGKPRIAYEASAARNRDLADGATPGDDDAVAQAPDRSTLN